MRNFQYACRIFAFCLRVFRTEDAMKEECNRIREKLKAYDFDRADKQKIHDW